MTSHSDEPLTVKAVHNFKGANNDELNFNKGDIITVTQKLEGGWWEGTLNGLTGWFPSNYVKESKEIAKNLGVTAATSGPLLNSATSGSQQDIQQDMKMYRAVVFKDIVDTETHHVKELTDFFQSQITPLRQSNCIPEKEWSTLIGNAEEVLDCHVQLLASLDGLKGQDGKEQKIGGCFMTVAPQLKKVHMAYCSNHPKAVAVMDRNKEALTRFLESHTAGVTAGVPSGLLPLVTGLSAPFRRLEKYPALLQELQRHTEECHIDRGDTQRAVFVYKDISVSCQNQRRQKELELEVMTGNIRNWQGESLESLGEIVHMGCVSLLGGQEPPKKKSDHHLVLFPKVLLVLSVSSRLSAFIYKTKILLSTLVVSKVDGLEGAPYAFEITGGASQHLVLSCTSKEEQDKWLSLLGGGSTTNPPPTSAPASCASTPKMSRPSATNNSPSVGSTSTSASSNPHSGPPTAPTVGSHVSQLHITLSPNCQQQPVPPPHQVPVGDRHSCLSGRSVAQPISSRIWSLWSLRPQPPQRSAPPVASNTKKDDVILRKSQRKKAQAEDKWYEEDMRVLQVIESYCNSAKSRFTVNSALLDTPQVIIAEDEKIIVEEMQGNTPVVQEKTLVDTVYALKDQVKDLKEETSILSKGLEEERRCRKKLEELVKKHIIGGLAASRDLLSGISDD